MKIILRFLAFILAGTTLLGFELIGLLPSWMIAIGAAVFLLVCIGLWLLIREYISQSGYRRLIVSPALLVLSSLLLFAFTEHAIVRHMFALGVSVVLGVVIYNIYAFIYRPLNYQPYALENITWYVSLFSIFFSLAGSASLVLFFSVNTVALGAGIAAAVTALTGASLVISKIPPDRAFSPALAIGLGTGAFFIGCRFLPAAPLVQAAFPAVAWYFVANVTRDLLLRVSAPSTIRRYALFSSFLIALIVLTAQWR